MNRILNFKNMNKEHAKRVLMLLERINQEIDILGSAILKTKLNPIPVRVKGNVKSRFS